MRILFVAPFVPGPNVHHAGGHDVFYLIKALAAHHEVSVLGLDTANDTAGNVDALQQFCRHVEIVPLRGELAKIGRYLHHLKWPRAVAMFYSAELAARLEQLVPALEVDLVQFENIQTIPYAARIDRPSVLDCIDLTFLPTFQQHLAGKGSRLRRLFRSVEWPRLMVYEARALGRFAGAIVRSARDANVIKALNPLLPVAVLRPWPLTYRWALDPERPSPRRRPDRPVVMFIGAMWRSVNSDACTYFLEQVWPVVRQLVPGVEFWIVGASPPESLTAWNGRNNVVVTGYVEDVVHYYRECSVLVVPLLAAGGIINKVADAMHIGLPVVATSLANQGIGAVPGRDLLIADDPADFAAAVIRLLTDDGLYPVISANAEAFMRQFFDWDSSIGGIDALYRGVSAPPPAMASSV